MSSGEELWRKCATSICIYNTEKRYIFMPPPLLTSKVQNFHSSQEFMMNITKYLHGCYGNQSTYYYLNGYHNIPSISMVAIVLYFYGCHKNQSIYMVAVVTIVTKVSYFPWKLSYFLWGHPLSDDVRQTMTCV